MGLLARIKATAEMPFHTKPMGINGKEISLDTEVSFNYGHFIAKI